MTLKHFPFPAGGGGIVFIHLYVKLIIFSFTATVELWVEKKSKTIFIARPKDAVMLSVPGGSFALKKCWVGETECSFL